MLIVFRSYTPLAFHGISGYRGYSGLAPDITIPRDPITGLPLFYGVKGVMREYARGVYEECKYYAPAFLFGVYLDGKWHRVYSDEIQDGLHLKDEWLCRWQVEESLIWKKVLGEHFEEEISYKPVGLSMVIDVIPRNKIEKNGVATTTWLEEEISPEAILVSSAWCKDVNSCPKLCKEFTVERKKFIGGSITLGRGMVDVYIF